MELELHDLLFCEFSKDGNGPHFYNCWNFGREIFRLAGKFLPLYSEWIQSIADRDALIRKLKNGDDFIELGKPEFLAIVTFELRPKKITHMGVVLDGHRFIHIRKKAGVAIERLDIGKWSKKIEGFYRYVANN